MPIKFIPDDLMGCAGCDMAGVKNLKRKIKGRLTMAVKRHVKSRSANKHTTSIVRGARRMGVDFEDPEVMGTWLQDIGKKIKGAIKKTKSVQLTTERGTAQLGPEGVTWTDKQAAADSDSGDSGFTQSSAAGGLSDMLKNPIVIGAGISIAALLLSKKGRKR